MGLKRQPSKKSKADDPRDIRFRILTWIGIIEQLAATKAGRVLRDIDLSFPQFVMLSHFSHRPDEGKTVTEVARALQQPQPGVTKTIAKLCEGGYLEAQPNPEDGRSKTLFLTPAGKRAFRRAVDLFAPVLEPVFRDWDRDDLDRLFADLDRIKIYLDENR